MEPDILKRKLDSNDERIPFYYNPVGPGDYNPFSKLNIGGQSMVT
jgi:hypothetical protein